MDHSAQKYLTKLIREITYSDQEESFAKLMKQAKTAWSDSDFKETLGIILKLGFKPKLTSSNLKLLSSSQKESVNLVLTKYHKLLEYAASSHGKNEWAFFQAAQKAHKKLMSTSLNPQSSYGLQKIYDYKDSLCIVAYFDDKYPLDLNNFYLLNYILCKFAPTITPNQYQFIKDTCFNIKSRQSTSDGYGYTVSVKISNLIEAFELLEIQFKIHID